VTYRYCTEASNQKSKYVYRKIFFYKKSTDYCICLYHYFLTHRCSFSSWFYFRRIFGYFVFFRSWRVVFFGVTSDWNEWNWNGETLPHVGCIRYISKTSLCGFRYSLRLWVVWWTPLHFEKTTITETVPPTHVRVTAVPTRRLSNTDPVAYRSGCLIHNGI